MVSLFLLVRPHQHEGCDGQRTVGRGSWCQESLAGALVLFCVLFCAALCLSSVPASPLLTAVERLSSDHCLAVQNQADRLKSGMSKLKAGVEKVPGGQKLTAGLSKAKELSGAVANSDIVKKTAEKLSFDKSKQVGAVLDDVAAKTAGSKVPLVNKLVQGGAAYANSPLSQRVGTLVNVGGKALTGAAAITGGVEGA